MRNKEHYFSVYNRSFIFYNRDEAI